MLCTNREKNPWVERVIFFDYVLEQHSDGRRMTHQLFMLVSTALRMLADDVISGEAAAHREIGE